MYILEKVKKDNKFLLKVLFFLINITIISSVVGTAALNITIFLFDLIFIFFLLKNFKKFKFKPLLLYSFFLINIFLLFNVFFSYNVNSSLITYFGIIKSFFFCFGALIIFSLNKKHFNSFIKIIFYTILFCSIDTLFQYLTGKDFFGFEKTHLDVGGGRLTGPFNTELVIGGFLAKVSFISSLYFFSKKYTNFVPFFLFLLLIIVFLTNERAPALMMFFSFLFFIIFFRSSLFKKKIKVLFIGGVFICIFLFVTLNDNLNQRFIKKSLTQFGFLEKSYENEAGSFFDSQWGAHFLTAFEIFKDNPFIGAGLNTFRFTCVDAKYETIKSSNYKSRCSTHPHNTYLQILSELGLGGFIIVISLLIILVNKINNNINSNYKFLCLSILIFLFWPIQTTGSLFSSWNSYFYTLNIILILYLTNVVKLKK
jgi:O-antigen ligase